MSSSQDSLNSYSLQKLNGNKYANVITTISLALFLLLWSLIWTNLQCLNERMRRVELDLQIIKTIHGIEKGNLPNNSIGQNRPLSHQPGLAISPKTSERLK